VCGAKSVGLHCVGIYIAHSPRSDIYLTCVAASNVTFVPHASAPRLSRCRYPPFFVSLILGLTFFHARHGAAIKISQLQYRSTSSVKYRNNFRMSYNPETFLPYREPGIVTILVQSSFLLILNVVNTLFDKLIFCGLLGQVFIGTAWGTPGAKVS
jgi:hypothetical protein